MAFRNGPTFRLSLSVLICPIIVACTTTIEPPTDVGSEVRTVILLDHGRHSSLVVPVTEGGYRRYSYGDWTYYAENKPGIWNGLVALLWPTQGALGRKALNDLESVPYAEAKHSLRVERTKLEGLVASLEHIYRGNQKSLIYNRDFDLEFVHHPETYSALNNSNQVIARWLEQMGCGIKGGGLFARWRVQTAGR